MNLNPSSIPMINPGQLKDGFISPFPLLVLLWPGEDSDLPSGKAGCVWPGEEKAPGRICCSLTGPAGHREGLLTRDGVDEVGEAALN